MDSRSPALAISDPPSVATRLTPDDWLDRFATAWRADRRLTAAEFAAEFAAELAAGFADQNIEQRLLAMLAYEEFRLRLEAGEPVDSQVIEAQFPKCRGDVRALIEVHRSLPGESELRAALESSELESRAAEPRAAKTAWPHPGQTLAGFKLLELLGGGAYARVYLAEEDALGRRRVVVKASAGGGKEADTLGKLSHPNIVPVYSVQVDRRAGLTLICMPFLGRITLHDVLTKLRGGRFPPCNGQALIEASAPPADEHLPANAGDRWLSKASYVDAVVHWGAQLAEALDYTNSKGILHRDLKPSNILVDGAGKPMLLDFNLSYDDQRQTRGVGGTPGYAAPEIVATLVGNGRDRQPVPDLRSDIYSLGVVLYELLSGELPFVDRLGDEESVGVQVRQPFAGGHNVFVRQSAGDWLTRQRQGPRSLIERNPALEPALASLIERCLAFEMEQRPATAYEVAAALRGMLSPAGRMKRFGWRHRRGLVSGVLALCGALAAGGYLLATLPSYAEQQFSKGLEAARRGEYPEALTRFTRAADHGFDRGQIEPHLGEAHFRLAQQALAAGDYALARDQAKIALDAGRRTWQTYLCRARAQFHLRDYDLALRDVSSAEKLRAAPEMHAVRGDSFCALSKWDSAIAAYEQAQAAGFESAGLMNNLGYALARSGDRREAIDWLDRAIAADSCLAAAYYQRASINAAIAAEVGHDVPESAIRDIEAAIERDAGNCRTYLSAAGIFAWRSAKTGQSKYRAKASAYLLQALRFGLAPSAVPTGDPLGEVAREIRGSQAFAAAVEVGCRTTAAATLGIVDSLAGTVCE